MNNNPEILNKGKMLRADLLEDSSFDSYERNPVASFAPNKVAHYIGKKV